MGLGGSVNERTNHGRLGDDGRHYLWKGTISFPKTATHRCLWAYHGWEDNTR